MKCADRGTNKIMKEKKSNEEMKVEFGIKKKRREGNQRAMVRQDVQGTKEP